MAAKGAGEKPAVWTNDQIIKAATGRFGDIIEGIKLAEPYEIGRADAAPIIVKPLTRRRRKQLKQAQAAYLLSASQLAKVMQDDDAAPETINRINNLTDAAEEQYDKALFGDAFDDVMDYFGELQEEFWDEMYVDIHKALVNRVDLPADTCPKCGQSLGGADAEGNDESSSTSSSDTGTNSAETSPASTEG